jgi:hypothetical protein
MNISIRKPSPRIVTSDDLPKAADLPMAIVARKGHGLYRTYLVEAGDVSKFFDIADLPWSPGSQSFPFPYQHNLKEGVEDAIARYAKKMSPGDLKKSIGLTAQIEHCDHDFEYELYRIERKN